MSAEAEITRHKQFWKGPASAGPLRSLWTLGFSPWGTCLRDGGDECGGNRIAVDGASPGAGWRLPHRTDASSRGKSPPKRSLDGAPWRV